MVMASEITFSLDDLVKSLNELIESKFIKTFESDLMLEEIKQLELIYSHLNQKQIILLLDIMKQKPIAYEKFSNRVLKDKKKAVQEMIALAGKPSKEESSITNEELVQMGAFKENTPEENIKQIFDNIFTPCLSDEPIIEIIGEGETAAKIKYSNWSYSDLHYLLAYFCYTDFKNRLILLPTLNERLKKTDVVFSTGSIESYQGVYTALLSIDNQRKLIRQYQGLVKASKRKAEGSGEEKARKTKKIARDLSSKMRSNYEAQITAVKMLRGEGEGPKIKTLSQFMPEAVPDEITIWVKKIREAIESQGKILSTYDISKMLNPRFIDDVYGHEDLKRRLKEQLNAPNTPRSITNWILVGSEGTGKSLMAKCLANEILQRFNLKRTDSLYEFDPKTRSDVLGERLKELERTLGVMSSITIVGEVLVKVIVIDEAHNLKKGFLEGIKGVLERTAQAESGKVHIVMIYTSNQPGFFFDPPSQALKYYNQQVAEGNFIEGIDWSNMEPENNMTVLNENLKKDANGNPAPEALKAIIRFKGLWEEHGEFNPSTLRRFQKYIYPMFHVGELIDFGLWVQQRLNKNGFDLGLTQEEIKDVANNPQFNTNMNDFLRGLTFARANKEKKELSDKVTSMILSDLPNLDLNSDQE